MHSGSYENKSNTNMPRNLKERNRVVIVFFFIFHIDFVLFLVMIMRVVIPSKGMKAKCMYGGGHAVDGPPTITR